MRRPSPWWLEIVCFFVGHDWKSSWRDRDDRAAIEALGYENLPYRLRRGRNPYYTHSAGWHYKCRRCRHRIRDDAWSPWYIDLWWAARQFASVTWIVVTCYRPWRWSRRFVPGEPYVRYPWYSWPVSILTAPIYGFGQAYGGWAHARRWPLFPVSFALWLDDVVHKRWIEGKRTFLYFHPPLNPNDPTETGFWSAYADRGETQMRWQVAGCAGTTVTATSWGRGRAA